MDNKSVSSFIKTHNDLCDWARDELANGSRIKASKLIRIAKKMSDLNDKSDSYKPHWSSDISD